MPCRFSAKSVWSGCRGLLHLLLTLLLLCFHVGEAANPGPLNVGTINPTGLNNKHHIVSTLPPGIYAVSETHLAAQGCRRFQDGLRFSKSSFRFLAGSHVPLRPRSDHSGVYSGVGFLSSVPARILPHDWSYDLYFSSRIQVAAFYVQPHWITGAVVYGYATGKQRTPELLEAAARRVMLQSSGPRFLAGDFNLEPCELQLEQWRALGFREVQDVAWELFGTEPKPTCKGATRKDFLFLSPELQHCLRAVSVEADWFPDHAVLSSSLEFGDLLVPRFQWRQPRRRRLGAALGCEQKPGGRKVIKPLPPSPAWAPDNTADVTARYMHLCHSYEDRLSEALVAGQGHPLAPSERGRAATSDITLVWDSAAPVSKGRPGEVCPTFFPASVRHCHWFRQLRRIQALEQALRKGARSPTAVTHRASLWHSILAAPGFDPSFTLWWSSFPDRAGVALPLAVPSLDLVSNMFVTFRRDVELFEADLNRRRCREAQERRRLCPHMIFRDIKDAPAAPVSSLLAGVRVPIEEVAADEAAVVFAGPVSVDPACPVWIQGAQHQVIHAEEDKLWLSPPPGCEPGAILHQDKIVGSLPALLRSFGSVWASYWQRHDGVSVGRWAEAINALTFDQVPEVAFPPFTPAQWRREVQRKKVHTAPGLDSISREDLLLFPDDLLSELLSIYQHAEATGEWPRPALEAVVSALAKRPSATDVGHYRPIIVLSLVYRVWSSLRGRQCLAHLAQFRPSGLYGCLPGLSASQLWWGLQARVESVRHLGGQVCGLVADLVKAFNHLPRVPTLVVGARLGLPKGVLRAWLGFLSAFGRRFRVRGSVGPPLFSSTGFPEGCAMSCVAMTLVNIALDDHIKAHARPAELLTFVDNWEVVAQTVPEIDGAHTALQTFCRRWDLCLDPTKTFAWASEASDRAALRSLGLSVHHDGRDLGAHMQYSRRLTNFTQVARLASLESCWIRLRESPAPLTQKMSAIVSAAWPRALHAVALVHLGDRHFTSLRSSAMKSLRLARPGASAKLQFSLLQYPTADPAFVALQQSALDLCRFSTQYQARACLDAIAQHCGPRIPGPIGVLLARFNGVGVSWIPDSASFSDEFGLWSPWSISSVEVSFRLAWHWQQVVMAQTAVRAGFQGLRNADPALTRRVFLTFSPEQQAYLRVCLNGTFFTQAELHHIGCEESNACLYCGGPDGIPHRLLECPHFQAERTSCTRLAELQNLSPCQFWHCWALRSPLHLQLQRALAVLPSVPVFQPVNARAQFDLFTDGTCLCPTIPELRLAAWSVIVARDSVDQPPVVLASGPLPGLLQSSFRSELFAVYAAVLFAVQVGVPVRVWCDCRGVVLRLRRMLEGGTVQFGTSNSDLWKLIEECLMHLVAPLTVHKVPSHEDPACHDDEVSLWAIDNNSLADRAAEQANLQRDAEVWQLWHGLRRHLVDEEARVKAIMKFHVDIAVKSTTDKGKRQLPPLRFVTQPNVPPVQTCPDDVQCAPLWGKYGRTFIQALVLWLQWLLAQANEAGSVCRWVSVYQLYFSFVFRARMSPPTYCAASKSWRRNPHAQQALPKRVRWFGRQLKDVLHLAGAGWPTWEGRPSSSILCHRMLVLPVRCQSATLELVDTFLLQHRRGQGKDWWRSVPLPEWAL